MKVRDLLKTLARDGWLRASEKARQGDGKWASFRRSSIGRFEVYTETGRFEMSDTRYAVIFEKSATGYGAYVPDLPGCIATGATLDLTRQRMCEAISLHLRAMREDGDTIPEPSHVEMREVA